MKALHFILAFMISGLLHSQIKKSELSVEINDRIFGVDGYAGFSDYDVEIKYSDSNIDTIPVLELNEPFISCELIESIKVIPRDVRCYQNSDSYPCSLPLVITIPSYHSLNHLRFTESSNVNSFDELDPNTNQIALLEHESSLITSTLTEILDRLSLPALMSRGEFIISAASVPTFAEFEEDDIHYFLYNPSLVDQINADDLQLKYAIRGVLLHELGHVLLQHDDSLNLSRDGLEFEADRFAGTMLFKLFDASLNQTLSMGRYMSETSISYPPREKRLEVVRNIWNDLTAEESRIAALANEAIIRNNKSVIDSAYNYYFNDEYDSVLLTLQNIDETTITDGPQNLRYLDLYGMTLLSVGELNAAINKFEEIYAQKPEDLDNKLRLGILEYVVENEGNSRSYFNEILDEVANDGPGLIYRSYAEYYIGLLELKRGNSEQALYRFNKSIDSDPSHTGALIERGGIYLTNREFKKAIDDLYRSFELSAEPSEIQSVLNDHLGHLESFLAQQLNGMRYEFVNDVSNKVLEVYDELLLGSGNEVVEIEIERLQYLEKILLIGAKSKFYLRKWDDSFYQLSRIKGVSLRQESRLYQYFISLEKSEEARFSEWYQVFIEYSESDRYNTPEFQYYYGLALEKQDRSCDAFDHYKWVFESNDRFYTKKAKEKFCNNDFVNDLDDECNRFVLFNSRHRYVLQNCID